MLKAHTIVFVILVSLVMVNCAPMSMNVKLEVMFAMMSAQGATITGEVMTANVLKDSLVMGYYATIMMNAEPCFIGRVSKLAF